MTANERYAGIRSIMETPIMDDRKWAKVPEIPADAFMVDLEDSVPPPRKEAARARVIEYLQQPEYFGGRPMIARPNNLRTPWGRDDIDALAEIGATCIAYPMCTTAEEILEVQEICRSHGSDPDIIASIETARAVVEVAKIAAIDKVVMIGIGVGDLSADMGVPLYGPGGELNELFAVPKAQVVVAGAAFGCLVGDFVYAPDLRDLDETRRRWDVSRRLGFTSGFTFYPPHVPIINEVFGASQEDADAAEEVIGLYEDAVAAGAPAVTLASGRTILVHDYQKALTVRARFAATRV